MAEGALPEAAVAEGALPEAAVALPEGAASEGSALAFLDVSHMLWKMLDTVLRQHVRTQQERGPRMRRPHLRSSPLPA